MSSLSPENEKLMISRIRFFEEVMVWSGEGKQRTKKKLRERLFLLTNVALYIFSEKKRKGGLSVVSIHSLVDLKESGFNRNNELVVNFAGKDGVFNLSVANPNNFLKELYAQHDLLLWGTIPQNVAGFINPHVKMQMSGNKKRMKDIMTIRYLAFAASKSVDPDPAVLSLCRSYDNSPTSTFTFSKMETKDFAPALLAVFLEADIRILIFDDFCGSNVTSPICFVFMNPSRIVELTLKNYVISSMIAPIKTDRNANNILKRLSFVNCSEVFNVNFLQSIKPVQLSIDTAQYRECSFSNKFTCLFLSAIENYTFFEDMINLSFIDCNIKGDSFRSFGGEILRVAPKLKNFVLERDDLDVCGLINDLLAYGSNVQSLVLRGNDASSVYQYTPSALDNLLFIDVSSCKWSHQSLCNLLTVICANERNKPFCFWIESAEFMEIDGGWSDALSMMKLSEIKTAITEMNFNQNQFSISEFDSILFFLSTQFPLFSTSKVRLRYVSFSDCFNEDTAEHCLSKLWEFMSLRDLWGLELRNAVTLDNTNLLGDFIRNLSGLSGFSTIDLCNNQIDKETALEILQFVQDSQSISEICVDHMHLDSQQNIIWFYQSLIMNPRILSINKKIDDIKEFQKTPDAKRLNKRIKLKRNICNLSQRLSLYLSLSGDYSIRYIHFNELDLEIKEGKASSWDTLYEVDFVNPFPNLFSVLSDRKYDSNEVHPLAFLVTEIVATSGKYGVFPPTEPPIEAPHKQHVLPPIFSSVIPIDEPDQYLARSSYHDIDLTEISQKISSEISKYFDNAKRKLDWKDTKQTSSLPPMNFN